MFLGQADFLVDAYIQQPMDSMPVLVGQEANAILTCLSTPLGSHRCSKCCDCCDEARNTCMVLVRKGHAACGLGSIKNYTAVTQSMVKNRQRP